MASNKKRRKAIKQYRKQQSPQATSRPHPDGDRRRKDFGNRIKDAMLQKQLLQQFGLIPIPEEESK